MKSHMALGLILLFFGGLGLLGCSSAEEEVVDVIEIVHQSESRKASLNL